MANYKYFENLLSSKENRMAEALDSLVDDLNNNKERTIFNFLGHSGSEDFLWALINMLSLKMLRIASNAAYVIGSIAETELGSQRVLSLTHGKKAVSILQDLTQMLTVEDAETVMNAAGTLGTLAETSDGREWMLKQSCIPETMTNITFLLGSDNHWTASNAALVLARITISDNGCKAVLDHPKSKYMLTRLVQSLGNDTAGRGMNAAFAIGRLLDTGNGKEKLLNCVETEKMITSLCRMLSKGDMGGAKNACFAISCLAMDAGGNQRVLNNSMFQDVLARLVSLLSNQEDPEAAWFSAMTLRTITSHKDGVLRLRQNAEVESALLKVENKSGNSKELNEEISKTLMHLKRLDKPDPPSVEVRGPTEVSIKWNSLGSFTGLQIVYKLFKDNKIAYKGQELQCTLSDLQPFTSYTFKLRASTVGDESPYSDSVAITTEEDVPSPPTAFRVLGVTPTQLRISWNPPEYPNGILRGYTVYLGEKIIDTITDLSYIISRLTPATRHTVHVCASTIKGQGERSSIDTMTGELGAHAPEKPSITVIGRNEIHVAWSSPVVPLGRFFRYELCLNNRVIYLGTERVFKVIGLTPDTEYIFIVTAITSEGRCTSEPAKKRTLKDKSQNEPGHHKLKTHSFMAKEFQVMQEKSKTQPNIVTSQKSKLKTKRKNNLRPASTISSSNYSETSARTDGNWASNELGVSEIPHVQKNSGQMEDTVRQNKTRKYYNTAILGGSSAKANYKSNSTHPQITDKSNAHNGTAAPLSTQNPYPATMDSTKTSSAGRSQKNTAPKLNSELSSWSKNEKLYPAAKELSFSNVSEASQPRIATTNRMRSHAHKGHVMMKGRMVLKSDKEILASKSQENQSKPVETGRGISTIPYYPDIVSQLRTKDTAEKSVLIRTKGDETPDSLTAEPGTARLDDLSNEPSHVQIPPIKHPLPHSLTREKHINEYPLHESTKRKGYPLKVQHNLGTSKLSTTSTSLPGDHIILKSTANSKYGLKYTHHPTVTDSPKSSESSVDNDSAFHSLSHIQDTYDDSIYATLHKPSRLLPIKADFLTKASSERNLHQEPKESRIISGRLKTPPKGYWSDHDVYPPKDKKKHPILTPINYRTFTGAHRPTKSIRLESPLVTNSDTWLTGNIAQRDAPKTGDNNRYKFIPTQFRTQPANLPINIRTGNIDRRLESLGHFRLKQDMPDRSIRTGSATSSYSPSPPQHRRQLRGNMRRAPRSSAVNENSAHSLNPISNGNHITDPEKLSSLLATLNYHHGYEVKKQVSGNFTPHHHGTDTKILPAATATTPAGINFQHISKSSSDVSSPSKLSSVQTESSLSKSPHRQMTSASSGSFYQQSQGISTASAYDISPTSSLSPLLNGKNGMMRQMAMIQGGGDPV